MNRTYHVAMCSTKVWLWEQWHCKLTKLYDGNAGHTVKPRPWYHMCCNGNAGGWRTQLCDMLEGYKTGYRYHEDKLRVNDG